MEPFRPNYGKRPPRLSRIFDHLRPFYFVTFNTRNRTPVLATPANHEAFVTFCEKALERDIAVGRYVLMPDHIHLFVVFPEADMTLTRWVHILKTVLGKKLAEAGIPLPHWQEGFFDHLLRQSESYGQKWEYVRKNPVRAGLCETPEDWPYQGEISRVEF